MVDGFSKVVVIFFQIAIILIAAKLTDSIELSWLVVLFPIFVAAALMASYVAFKIRSIKRSYRGN